MTYTAVYVIGHGATLFVRSVSFFSASGCFMLFEVTFSFNSFNLSSKFVFSTELSISALVAKFAWFNLVAKSFSFNLLNLE